MFDPQPLSIGPQRSLGKSINLNRSGKTQISDFSLPPIADTQNQVKIAVI